jgi:formylglycine-generating enzyme required for sulfatase activity
LPTPPAGTTITREIDGMVMVYVPGGAFQMGSTWDEIEEAFYRCEEALGSGECDWSWYEDEYSPPEHSVAVDGFWIDRTEVSNEQYILCVEDGDCDESAYVNNSTYNSPYYPVVGVSWNDADHYCTWAGGRLPTEAEWEYAARGEEHLIYPWGNNDPACDLAQFYGCSGRPNHVERLPYGASWVGALNMAGNVWEWVADWYGRNYYRISPSDNPTGPESGTHRVLRGGSWGSIEPHIRTAYRFSLVPTYRSINRGFRCVVTPEG